MNDAAGRQSFHWRGHRLELLAERAVWDAQQRVLLVADLHLGKAECFQASGIALPSDGDAASLNSLLELAHRLRPRQVVVLGDLVHGRAGLTAELRAKLRALPELLGCRLRLIEGNHERGSWLEGLELEPSTTLGPLWLSHAPEPRPGLLNLCGHLHPVAVVGRGADRLRLPCFAYRPGGLGSAESVRGDQLLLPAFGVLTGGHPCPEADQLWLVAEGSVVPWPTPGLPQRLAAPPPSRPHLGHHASAEASETAAQRISTADP